MALPTILPEQLCDAKALSNLTCPVCQEIFREPKCAPCGHFLCEGCWLRQLHANQSCPLCRKPVKEIAWNQGMQLYMASQRVRCAYKGCHWQGDVEAYGNHLEECPAKQLRETQQKAPDDELEAWLIVADNDAEIADLNKRLDGCRAQCVAERDRHKTLTDSLQSLYADAVAEARRKQEAASDLERRIAEKDAQLQEKNKQIAAQDKALKEQLCILRRKDAEVGDLCGTLRQTLESFEDYKRCVGGGSDRLSRSRAPQKMKP